MDDNIEQEYGFKISKLTIMCFNLIDTVGKRINKHTEALRSVLRKRNKKKLVIDCNNVFLETPDNKEKFFNYMRDNHRTLEEIRQMLLIHSDLFLLDLFVLDINDFVQAYPDTIEVNHLLPVLHSWSLAFGDLEDQQIEHLFMGNPIWERPFIKLDETTFFCPIVGLLISFCLELMERVIRDNERLWQRYEKRRAQYLEDEISRVFSQNLPQSNVYKGVRWHHPGENKDYENDVLVVFDVFAFVIEAKSGRLRASSKRGAPHSLAEDVKKLISEASVQAHRFVNYLKANPKDLYKTSTGQMHQIDVSNVKYFQPLTITLESLGSLSGHLPSLQKGWLTGLNLTKARGKIIGQATKTFLY